MTDTEFTKKDNLIQVGKFHSRISFTAVLGFIILVLLAGCGTDSTSRPVEQDRDVPSMNQTEGSTSKDSETNNLLLDIPIRDEISSTQQYTRLPNNTLEFRDELSQGVVLKTTYSSEYSFKTWRITDIKSINILVEVEENPNNVDVYIEHMHADAIIQATKEGVDGLKQDSMDDRIHGSDQPGFFINKDYPYTEVFLIEGYSKTLTEGWGFMVGEYGALKIRETRITESNLRKQGAFGTRLSLVYDIVYYDQSLGKFVKPNSVNHEFNFNIAK